jgi:starch phosphorylase
MVQQYFENYYKTSFEKRLILSERKWSSAKELASWKENLKRNWSNIKLVNLEAHDKSKTIYVGENLPVAAELNLGELSPQDVEVQAYYGPLDQQDNPEYNETIVLKSESKKLKDGNYKFTGSITTRRSGQQGFTIRVLPKHPLLINQFELGLIYWGG